MNRLAIVTASIDLLRAAPAIRSWLELAEQPIDLYTVRQTVQRADWQRTPTPVLESKLAHRAFIYDSRPILGVVPAFAIGVQQALHDGHQIIACLHDDLEIEEQGWDETVVRLFKACPRAGLLGFGGAKGLAESDIYQTRYNPMQLVRKEFISNMRHAEAHGQRVEVACPVAVLDGFSQVGLAEYWRGVPHLLLRKGPDSIESVPAPTNLFAVLAKLGVMHHAYDAALGAYAKQLGYQVWYLPIKVHHHGGLTAVADPRYLEWARANYSYEDLERPEKGTLEGDAAFWEKSHRVVYELFRDVLPIRVS